MLCLLCNKGNAHQLDFKQLYPQHKKPPIELSWYGCKNCKGWYNYPSPTQEQIDNYWQTVSFNNAALKDDYLTFKKDVYQKVLNITETQGPGKNILDFGSNFGQFLDMAQKEGWTTFGIEPFDEAAEYCKKNGHILFKSFKELDKDSEQKFRAITAIDSFYYVREPYIILQNFYNHLETDGKLVMRISNKKNFVDIYNLLISDKEVKNKKISGILQSQFHSIHCNKLKRVCLDIGFKKVKIKIGAATMPFSRQSLFTKVSYIVSGIIYYLSLGTLNISPGIILIAQK